MLDGNVDSCWDEVCVHDDGGVECVKNAVASVVCFRGVMENRAENIGWFGPSVWRGQPPRANVAATHY